MTLWNSKGTTMPIRTSSPTTSRPQKAARSTRSRLKRETRTLATTLPGLASVTQLTMATQYHFRGNHLMLGSPHDFSAVLELNGSGTATLTIRDWQLPMHLWAGGFTTACGPGSSYSQPSLDPSASSPPSTTGQGSLGRVLPTQNRNPI